MSPRLLYIHAPKCGGTSFGSSIRAAYATSQSTIDLGRSERILKSMHPDATGPQKVLLEHEVRKIMLGELMDRGVKCISAHVSYHEDLHEGLDPDRKAVTLLRDPVSRFMSHYYYVQRRHPDPSRPDTLEAFVETEMAQSYGSTYLLYYARTFQHTTKDLAAAMTLAKANLDRFALIGDLKRGDAFRKALRNLVRRPLLSWERNKRPGGKGASNPSEISADLRARITEICAPDIELYKYATSLPTCA